MRRMILKKNNYQRTINKILFIVFFCLILNTIILYNIYTKLTSNNAFILINQKLDKIINQFFSDLITDDVINKDSVSNILVITKNNNDEILAVNYNLEKTYAILTNVTNILEKGLSDLENGKIDVTIYDKYIKSGDGNLILNIPLFLGINNIFLNNLGPRIPIGINFNETLLTNIKTKVTNYGFNNALLEIYVTVEMEKLIITPLKKDENKFLYDILVGAVVVNGSVPEFYGDAYESAFGILDIPIPLEV